ncbi:MAG TPA: DNRLRE domain-containing protein, partial [Candidatus Dormibacteraeota bacterium]|nr:DNRLRE domain-containing protein [Candidatus Dormibacteraeota bacterium]
MNPPLIKVQPHSTNVVEGQTIALEVQADGAGLTYSWQKVGGAIDPANPTVTQAVLIITNAALSDAGDYFCVVANAAGSDTSVNATVTVDLDVFPPKFVSAAEDPFDLTVVNVKVDEPLCQGSAITPNCTKESWQPFLWHVREKNNPSAELGVVGVTINGLDVALQTAGARTIGVQYVVAVELGVADLHDNEIPEGTQIDVEFSGVGFKQNAGTYLGTQDTFITSDAPDTSQSTLPYLESDQVNPQSGISQALLRFDNIFGDTPGQVPPGALILSATLVLNHTRADADGTPVNLYRMLTDWDQNTATWNFFIDGIQPDDIEAAAEPELQIISSLPPFTLNLDVTESIRTWAEGAPNYGWVFINTADNGYRPDSSDAADPPGLIIKYSTGQDTEGPVLRSVTANPNGTTMSLSFSEPLEPGSAQAKANYSLTPTVAVNSAVLSADGRTVTLTTAARAAGIYLVKVSNVTDNAPLRNVINPNPTSMVATQINVLFTYGTGTWQYETNSQDATLAVTPWYAPAFNDGSWQSGQAFFGFEQDAAVINILPPPKIVTPLPANSDANFPDASVTAYFRRLVTLPALPPRTAFQLSHYIDDGAV